MKTANSVEIIRKGIAVCKTKFLRKDFAEGFQGETLSSLCCRQDTLCALARAWSLGEGYSVNAGKSLVEVAFAVITSGARQSRASRYAHAVTEIAASLRTYH